MSDASQRANETEDRPDVARWTKRLRKMLAEMPKDLWIYAGNGTLFLMVKRPDGTRYTHGSLEDGHGYDQEAIITTLPGFCDGGDW